MRRVGKARHSLVSFGAMPSRSLRSRRSGGFSLIELGIVIAVIVVLSGILITGAGYFRAAKQRTAVDLVLTIRKASSQFALRHSKGLAYGRSAAQNDPQNVTLAGLRGEGFLPTNVTTLAGAPGVRNTLSAIHTSATSRNIANMSCHPVDAETTRAGRAS